MNPLLQKIHREDIYQNFTDLLPFQSEATNIQNVLDDIFSNYSNKEVTILEVGSWKGLSAIVMAQYFLKKNIVPTMLCVDIFLGSTYHREHQEFFEMLKCKNGFPTLYQQFLSNIIHSNLQNNVIPIPHSSHDAARYLNKLNIRADFCFVDACHEFDEVYDDIKSYWNLVKLGGTLFGDDYGWPGVTDAVDLFITSNKLEDKSILYDNIWVIKKD